MITTILCLNSTWALSALVGNAQASCWATETTGYRVHERYRYSDGCESPGSSWEFPTLAQARAHRAAIASNRLKCGERVAYSTLGIH